MSQTYKERPYEAKWNQLYPGTTFPDPQLFPHMYKASQTFNKFVDYVDPDNEQCTDTKYCPKGLIDYECQLQYNCYLNLANLAIHVIGFLILLACLIGALNRLFVFVGRIVKALSIFSKITGCIGGCLKTVSMGLLGDEVVYLGDQSGGKVEGERRKVGEELRSLGIEINMEELDQFRAKKIMEIIQDYSIEEEAQYQ